MKFVYSFILGALLLLQTSFMGSETPISALILVITSIIFVFAINGMFNPTALVTGALGALAYEIFAPLHTAFAVAALFLCLYAVRSIRIQGGLVHILIHLFLAGLGGLLGSWIIANYFYNGIESVPLFSLLIASVLICMPWFFPTEDLFAQTLSALAGRVNGSSRWKLEGAASLRRKMVAQKRSMSRAERKRIAGVFKSVIKLGRSRLNAGGQNEADAIDEAIAKHVEALERVHQAIGRRKAAQKSMTSQVAEELNLETCGVNAEADAWTELRDRSKP